MEEKLKEPKEEPQDSFDDALRTLASAAIELDSMPLPKAKPPSPVKAQSPSLLNGQPPSLLNGLPPSLPKAEPLNLPIDEPLNLPKADTPSLPKAEPLNQPKAEPPSLPKMEPPKTPKSQPKAVAITKNGLPGHAEFIEPPWYDVGVFKSPSCIVNDFYFSKTPIDHSSDTSESVFDYDDVPKMELLPGAAYKFRVAALNSCGRGEWSDISAFKTCLPGFPSAPCSIRISRSAEGALLHWDPPTLCSGKIIEYSVCLAIRSQKSISENLSLKDLPFVRVYCGVENNAFVENKSLDAAFIDKTVKPAIIFRIAARNDKGYGPATQVRWLQDSQSASKGDKHGKREAKK